MSITKDTLVDALRLRYDAYSAETVFTLACAKAGLEDKTTFDNRELASFRGALERVGDRVGSVLARIDDLLGGATTQAAEPEQKKETPKAEPKSEAKPEAKAEAKSDHKKDKDAKKSDAKKSDADAKSGTEATIILRGVDVADDEQVLVCGAFPSLGDWDPDRARPMTREGDQWLAKLELAPDAEVAFKFLRRSSGGQVTWEAGDDRHVRANQRLDVTWRSST